MMANREISGAAGLPARGKGNAAGEGAGSTRPGTGWEITIADTGERFSCGRDQNVLAAMERLGRNGIPVGCRGGGCGICRVRVVGSGAYRTQKMSRAQVSASDEAEGICLACKLIPEGPLTVRPMGLLRRKLA